jgi:hypothetical protein
VRRRGHNIFEISDEPWSQGGAAPDEHQADIFEFDGPRSVARRSQPVSDDLESVCEPPQLRLSDGPQASIGRGSVSVAGALVAGAIAMASTALLDRGPEPTSRTTRVTRAPSAVKSTSKDNRTTAERRPASCGHKPSDASTKTRHSPVRPARVDRRATRLESASAVPAPRVTESAGTLELGHEFSFER